MKIINVTYQSKIDKNVFIKKNWMRLLDVLKEEYDYFHKEYRKSLRNTLLTVAFSLAIVSGIIWFNRATISLNHIFVIFMFWALIFVIGFVLEVIEFPHNYKCMTDCGKASIPFRNVNIEDDIPIKDLIQLFNNDSTFNHKDYKQIKKFFTDLWVYETVSNGTVLDFKTDDAKDEIIDLEYCDEDGIVQKFRYAHIPIKKSIKLKEGEYLIQMTEDGLVVVKPK